MSEPLLEIHEEPVEDAIRVAVSGELDLATAPILAAALKRRSSSSERIELDLGGVSFMDSSGIQLLIDARQAAQRRRREVRIAAASPEVSRALGMVGMQSLLPT
jgi:anti-anti-sigma factor